MNAYKVKVASLTTLTPRVKTIRLDLGGGSFPFQAGQYLLLGVDLGASGRFAVHGGKSTLQERPFSITSSPLEKDFIEVTVVKKDDGFTADYFLNYMNPGEEVKLMGPLGDFYFDEKKSKPNVVLIGAGSGVMPLVTIASYIKERKLPQRVRLIASFRDQDRIVLGKEIAELAKCPNITSEITLTRENWSGTTGRINAAMIMHTGFPPEETDFYLCGPAEFKKDMENILLKECKVPTANIIK